MHTKYEECVTCTWNYLFSYSRLRIKVKICCLCKFQYKYALGIKIRHVSVKHVHWLLFSSISDYLSAEEIKERQQQFDRKIEEATILQGKIDQLKTHPNFIQVTEKKEIEKNLLKVKEMFQNY
jgi:hypothetical protein